LSLPRKPDEPRKEMINIDNYINSIMVGDCRKIIPILPRDSVDMAITSPPYWQLRDYNHPQQLGRENTLEEYLQNLSDVFEMIREIIKKQGSLWIVIGDRYHKKNLLGVPWKLILRLKEKGWILRNACIWHKPNAMPVSVKDRLNQNFEYLFHLVKSHSYYYSLDEVRSPHKTIRKYNDNNLRNDIIHGRKHRIQSPYSQNPQRQPNHPGSRAFHPLGKNPGAMISVPASRSGKHHPATFPPEICRVPILSSCPPGGLVLDPFAGLGNSLREARKLGRNFIGIELNSDYAKKAVEYNRLRIIEKSQFAA